MINGRDKANRMTRFGSPDTILLETECNGMEGFLFLFFAILTWKRVNGSGSVNGSEMGETLESAQNSSDRIIVEVETIILCKEMRCEHMRIYHYLSKCVLFWAKALMELFSSHVITN